MNTFPDENREVEKIELILNKEPILSRFLYNDGTTEEAEVSSYICSVTSADKNPTAIHGKPLELIALSAAIVAELSEDMSPMVKLAYIKLLEKLVEAMKGSGTAHQNFKRDLEETISPEERKKFTKMMEKYKKTGEIDFNI